MTIGAFISGCSGLALTPEETVFFEQAQPWGLILFRRNCESEAQIRDLAENFRRAVGRRDAPVLVDQEGGRVQRLGPPLEGWRRYPPASAYGTLYRRDPIAGLRAARRVGQLMAADLTAAGITVNCVPVLDVPQPGSSAVISDRAYSSEPADIIALARAHAAGFLSGGVSIVIKHIPGHGRARVDSHHELPVVDAPLDELRRHDFLPFAALADAPMAMTAHVVYTAIDRHAPATLSKTVIADTVRRDIGFGGLLMTDDLSMRALSGSFRERAKQALAAGCDVVLHCNGNMDEMREVAAGAGVLKGTSMRRARAAMRTIRRPQDFDRKAALAELETLVSA
jgi:beta-N-acetylhexosaminidase